jgi:hypothetical protein
VTVHLAGALFGFLYYKFQWRISPLWSNFTWKRQQRVRPRLHVYHEQEAITPTPRPPVRNSVDEHLEAKLDAVLEKIKLHGKDSLTESDLAACQRDLPQTPRRSLTYTHKRE